MKKIILIGIIVSCFVSLVFGKSQISNNDTLNVKKDSLAIKKDLLKERIFNVELKSTQGVNLKHIDVDKPIKNIEKTKVSIEGENLKATQGENLKHTDIEKPIKNIVETQGSISSENLKATQGVGLKHTDVEKPVKRDQSIRNKKEVFVNQHYIHNKGIVEFKDDPVYVKEVLDENGIFYEFKKGKFILNETDLELLKQLGLEYKIIGIKSNTAHHGVFDKHSR